ncbi:DUF1501 domain-containing protein [Chitinilyticum piscinae]|uniref:DUF1501 domain-containing protein n=1 Tax=Chitinilyticum piscinae TaxID=2866724 RepID=A0A8J7K7P2_9NEIS|nr:DUF1501 domain-containing protein [Chitinilyticum piscinae]MBE9608383.1 DUF1501 domain-containing protein [Chitinilyticum piscinae]
MNRRDFLALLAASAALTVPVGRSAWAAGTNGQATDRKLVVILLRGAVDGLSVLPPWSDPDYYQERRRIAIARPGEEGGAIRLDARFGLHPALASLVPLWQAGQLAFIPASGSPDPTRSHFDAQDYLETATPGTKSTGTGWLNRLLATLPPQGSGDRALSLGATQPRILTGTQPVTILGSGKAASRQSALDRPRIASAFDALYRGNDRLSQQYRIARNSREQLRMTLESEMDEASRGAPLPDGFAGDAQRLGRLLRGNPALQIAFADLGGWDTHINQGSGEGQLANRLEPLGKGLVTLARELGQDWDKTVVLVMSEFGRTIRENGTGGTDHGHGNVMWLLGGNIAGGRIHGEWRGLSERYQSRDVPVLNDYRAILAAVLTQHLRLGDRHLASVLPDIPVTAAGWQLLRS